MEAFHQSVHVQMFCVQSSDTRDVRECAECKEIKSSQTLTNFSTKQMEMEAERGLWQVQMPVIALETMSTNCSYNIKVDITPNALTRLCRLKWRIGEVEASARNQNQSESRDLRVEKYETHASQRMVKWETNRVGEEIRLHWTGPDSWGRVSG